MGSVLMAKKRYVGFKYEHPDDKEPVFDAKGIETIRRDGFPAQGKIEEVCLKYVPIYLKIHGADEQDAIPSPRFESH